jgi:hypothetical protein
MRGNREQPQNLPRLPFRCDVFEQAQKGTARARSGFRGLSVSLRDE